MISKLFIYFSLLDRMLASAFLRIERMKIMANLSDASGGMAIYAKTPEQINKVFQVIKETWKDGEYGAFFTEEPKIDLFDDDLLEGYVQFSGTGRWTFQNTLERLPDLFEYCFEGRPQGVEDFTWWINFNYFDIELGMETYYQAVDQIYHTEGDSLEKCTFTPMDMEDIPITLYNMCENGWKLPDALEYLLPFMCGDGFEERDAELLEDLLSSVMRYPLYCSTIQESLQWFHESTASNPEDLDDEILEALFEYWQTEGFYHKSFGRSAEDFDDLLYSDLNKDELNHFVKNDFGIPVSDALEGVFEDSPDAYLHLPYRELNSLLNEAGYPTLEYSEFNSINKRTYWKGEK